MDCSFKQEKSKVSFSQKELYIIREMFVVGSISTPSIDQYLDNALDGEEYEKAIQANKILYKLGFEGINKDGTDQ